MQYRNLMRSGVSALLGALCLVSSAAAQMAGEWEGVLLTPGGPQAISFALQSEGGVWSGVFSVPAENLERAPIPSVRVDGDSVVLLLRDPGIVLRSVVAGDSVHGALFAGAISMPVLLARPGSALALRLRAELAAALRAARDRPLVEAETGPALARLNAGALQRLLNAARTANSDAIVIMHDGELAGGWYTGGRPRRIEAMSATKSIVNLAVGRLITTGAIPSLDVPVHHYYPEWNEGAKARVTLRHLLNHTSGLHADRTTEAIYASDDFVRHALDAELTSEPGTVFFYNNNATNLVAGIVGRAAGKPLDEFLRDDLFARLGITDFGWTRDRAGNPHGMAGLQILPADLAKLGQLVLDGGRHAGEQLIAAEFVAESTRAGSTLSPGVGLLWWLIRERGPGEERPAADAAVIGYRAEGYLGQYLVIYPRERLVAVRMVAHSPAYDREADGFGDFQAMVRALVPAAP